jgi:hypothetical protein
MRQTSRLIAKTETKDARRSGHLWLLEQGSGSLLRRSAACLDPAQRQRRYLFFLLAFFLVLRFVAVFLVLRFLAFFLVLRLAAFFLAFFLVLRLAAFFLAFFLAFLLAFFLVAFFLAFFLAFFFVLRLAAFFLVAFFFDFLRVGYPALSIYNNYEKSSEQVRTFCDECFVVNRIINKPKRDAQ